MSFLTQFSRLTTNVLFVAAFAALVGAVPAFPSTVIVSGDSITVIGAGTASVGFTVNVSLVGVNSLKIVGAIAFSPTPSGGDANDWASLDGFSGDGTCRFFVPFNFNADSDDLPNDDAGFTDFGIWSMTGNVTYTEQPSNFPGNGTPGNATITVYDTPEPASMAVVGCLLSILLGYHARRRRGRRPRTRGSAPPRS